jgi:hypothetical protein
MKYQLLLLLLISLSGCSSSLVKDEKASQEIILTKKLQDEVAINLDVRELPKSWIDSKTIGCCLYSVNRHFFNHTNLNKLIEVLEQRCGIGVEARWRHESYESYEPIIVEVGECSEL